MFPFPSPLLMGTAGAPLASYITAESAAEQSSTGGTITGATFTYPGLANTDYLGFWSQDVTTNSTASITQSDIQIAGVSIFNQLPQMTPVQVTSPPDYNMMGGIFRFQAGASPNSKSFTAYGQQTGTLNTVKLRNSRLTLIKTGSDDHYTESLARQTFTNTTTNKSFQTVGTLSFTPSSSGDFILWVSFHCDLSSLTNTVFSFQISDGTNTTTERFVHPNDTANRIPVMIGLFLPAISGAESITLQVRQGGTGTATIGVSDIRMVAVRESRFAHVYKTSLSASSSGTETTYTTALSQTFTPAAADHLTVCCYPWRSSTTAVSVFARYLDDATVVDEGVAEFGAAANSGYGGFSHRLAAYTATSKTQALQRKAETSAATTTIWGAVSPNASVATIVTLDLTGL